MQYLGKCHSNTCEVWFPCKGTGKIRAQYRAPPYEIFALSGLRRCFSSDCRQCGRAMIWLYRHTLSPLSVKRRHFADLLGLRHEAIEALRTVGRGWMTLARLLRFQPWGHSGIDNVPLTKPRAPMVSAVAFGRWRGSTRRRVFGSNTLLAQLSSARKPEETRGRLEIGRRTRLPRTRWFGLRGFGRWCRWRRVSAL